jgi:RND family efflux transporter MFP subunit
MKTATIAKFNSPQRPKEHKEESQIMQERFEHSGLAIRRKTGFACLCVLCAFVVNFSVGCGGQHADPRDGSIAHIPRLETVKPEVGPMEVVIELSAVVEPMERADLCARVPGVVKSLQLQDRREAGPARAGGSLNGSSKAAPTSSSTSLDPPEVDIGTVVKAGETLVQLDIPDLLAEKDAKEALLDQAEKQKLQAAEMANTYEAEFKRNQEQHDRIVMLVKREAVNKEREEETKHQLDAAKARREAAYADLKVADSRIKVAKADVEKLKVLIDYATIRAPFNGVITKRWVDRGNMVKDPGTPLLTIMRIDKVRLLLDIPQRDVPLINATEQNPNPNGLGDKVVLQIPALRDTVPGGEFTGAITRLASALDPTTRTMRVEVHLANEIRGGNKEVLVDKAGLPVRPLKPGMYGSAKVYLETRPNVLTIPSTALVRRGDRVEVYYVENPSGEPLQGKVRIADDIELGLDDGRRVEIRKGLTGNEFIIAKGKGVLHAGDTVIAIPFQEADQKREMEN